jgi:hypothetical protein
MHNGQSKKFSLLEAFGNVAVGYFISFLSQILIFPIFGIHTSIKNNILIGLCFTVISIARSYFLRRVFNKIKR